MICINRNSTAILLGLPLVGKSDSGGGRGRGGATVARRRHPISRLGFAWVRRRRQGPAIEGFRPRVAGTGGVELQRPEEGRWRPAREEEREEEDGGGGGHAVPLVQ
jgi:hypothetical protein